MKYFVTTLFLLAFFSTVFSQSYSKVKIYTDQDGLRKLAELGVAVDHGERKGNLFFISDFSQNEIQIIKENNFSYDILIDDVKTYYAQRNLNDSGLKNLTCDNSSNATLPAVPDNFETDESAYAGFYTYQQMLDALDNMASLYPNLISVKTPISSFQTWEGRPIYHVKISDNPNQDETSEPNVLYTAIHHAREPMSMSQTLFYMWYLLENYESNDEVKFIVDNMELYFVPCINPDGYIHNEANDPSGFGMHRKNKRPVGSTNPGVDLNRNYSYGWGTTGVDYDENHDTYPGGPDDGNDYSFSEPETQAIQYLIENIGFVSAFNAHTYGNTLLFPVGTTTNEFADHHDYFTDLSGEMCRHNNYFPQKSSGLYPASGDSDDYMYKMDIGVGQKDTVFAMTPEVGTGFWPAPSEVIPTCQNMIFPNLVLAKMTHVYYVIDETDPSGIESLNGDFNLDIQRLGRMDGSVDVSFIPYTNIDNLGAAQTFEFEVLESQSFQLAYSLSPTIQLGDPIQYIIELDNGVWVERDTITKTYGVLNVLSFDDASSTAGWNGDWNSTSVEFYSPSTSFTDSPGDYSADATDIYTMVESIDLQDVNEANVSFYAKWEIEADYDYCQFQVSTNSGSTWIPQCGKYTVEGSSTPWNGSVQPDGEPVYEGTQTEWVLEEIDLSDYIGQEIQVRFVFESDGGLQQDGFYFDDFKVSTDASSASLDLLEWKVAIYPNPANDNLTIKLPVLLSDPNIVVVNNQGQIVLNINNLNESDEFSVLTSNLRNGLYTLIVFDGEQKLTTAKIAISH